MVEFAPFIMVVAIVAISVGAGLAHKWMKLRHDGAAQGASRDQEMAEVKADVARLADRVKVLEKLAVDADRQLSAEISKLR